MGIKLCLLFFMDISFESLIIERVAFCYALPNNKIVKIMSLFRIIWLYLRVRTRHLYVMGYF